MSAPVKHRILVVDDDESVREVFTAMLEERGYEVASAENGFDALLKVKDAVIPEVIISDLNMPKCPACQWYDAASRRFQSSRAAALMEAELYRLESWRTLFMLREKIIRIRC